MPSRPYATATFAETVRRLIDTGRRLDSRHWVTGTSGNFSAVLSSRPLRVAITASRVHKGRLTARQFLQVDAAGRAVGRGLGRPSAETRLHLEIVQARGAGAVLHTHSVWGTIVSDLHADARGLAIEGYEMLKGLSGIVSHEHREWLPIIENDQDMERLAREVCNVLDHHPGCHGLLLRKHGLYTWGATLEDAERHVEVLEFLLETIGRRSAPWP